MSLLENENFLKTKHSRIFSPLSLYIHIYIYIYIYIVISQTDNLISLELFSVFCFKILRYIYIYIYIYISRSSGNCEKSSVFLPIYLVDHGRRCSVVYESSMITHNFFLCAGNIKAKFVWQHFETSTDLLSRLPFIIPLKKPSPAKRLELLIFVPLSLPEKVFLITN